MPIDSDAAADTVANGDGTNRVIDRLDDLDPGERYRLDEALFDACRPMFKDAADWYVRQSVVRVLCDGYPGIERHPDGVDTLDVEDLSRTDVAAQRDRYVAFLLAALNDPDSRVRNRIAT